MWLRKMAVSTPKIQDDDTVSTASARELECPVCLEYMIGPISLCQSGHSICKKCKKQLPHAKCPICNKEFVADRNIVLEKLATFMRYPCRNDGCTKICNFREIELHERECNYARYRCPLFFTGCDWKRKVVEMKNHIETFHASSVNVWTVYKNLNYYVTYYNDVVFTVFGSNENNHIRTYSAVCCGPNTNIDKYILRMDFEDQTGKGFALCVSAPCIGFCDIEQVLKSDKICVSREMLNSCFRATSDKYVSEVNIVLKEAKVVTPEELNPKSVT